MSDRKGENWLVDKKWDHQSQPESSSGHYEYHYDPSSNSFMVDQQTELKR